MEPTPDEALLTAYLVGELVPQDRQQLEQRLANEPELRQQLAMLEETWHCLDLLEQESVDAEQVETTLRIAAVSTSEDPLATSKIRQIAKRGVILLVSLAIFVVTFQWSKQVPLDDPSFRQKIECLDMYLAILDDDGSDGIKLVRQLAREHIFLPPPYEQEYIDPHEYEPNKRSWFGNNGALSVFRCLHEFDDPGMYQLLDRNLQRYNGLTRDKMGEVEQLHRDIESASRRDELLLTVQNYYHWFKSLQPYEKVELREHKSIAEKVSAIIEKKISLELQPGDTIVSSEVIGIEESGHLAETLETFSLSQKLRLLNEAPARMINELKQTSLR